MGRQPAAGTSLTKLVIAEGRDRARSLGTERSQTATPRLTSERTGRGCVLSVARYVSPSDARIVQQYGVARLTA